MSFGNVIRKLRREAEMTQEELAELLAISPQAVSRWETEAAMPDISLLPRLANIFNVSADELLEINVAKNEEKIEEFLKNAKRALHHGDFQKSAEILGEAHSMFPRSYKIMYELANSLLCVYSRQGKKEYDDVIALCRNLLNNCTDNTLRYEAMETLGLAYHYAGKDEEMIKLSEQMTPFAYSKERFMMWRWGFDSEALAKRQGYFSDLLHELLYTLLLIPNSKKYSREETIQIWKQIIDITEIIFPNGDYHVFAQIAATTCDCIARKYLQNGEKEECLYWFERACDYIVYLDTYDTNPINTAPAPHTSLALNGVKGSRWIKENGRTMSEEYLKAWHEGKEMEKIREEARFKSIIERLKEHAVKT